MGLIAFIVVLGVLIFVHELGHFLAAKAVGIGVPRFSIGLGPITPLRFTWGETEYVLSWVPFGGYVKMASREELEEMAALEGGETELDYPPEKLYEGKPLWARILVISAGVIMNALFAWAAYSAVLMAYGQAEDPTTRIARVELQKLPVEAAPLAQLMPPGATISRVDDVTVETRQDLEKAIVKSTSPDLRFFFEEDRPPLTIDVTGLEKAGRQKIADALVPQYEARVTVSPGGAAAAAGLESEDLVVAVDGEPIDSWDAMVAKIEPRAGDELLFKIERGGETVELTVVPQAETVTDPATGTKREAGRIGVNRLIVPVYEPVGILAAIRLGGERTVDVTALVFGTFKGMIVGQISPRQLGGPVLIGQMSARVARQGLEYLLSWMAFLSVNLAILNLLPIPVLDGGHLVFLVAEGLRGGRPVSKELRQRLTMIGFYLLLALMVFVTFNDIVRSFFD